MLVKTDIHELRLVCQLLALSESLILKTEADSGDQKSIQMFNQVEAILSGIRYGRGLKPKEIASIDVKGVDDENDSPG